MMVLYPLLSNFTSAVYGQSPTLDIKERKETIILRPKKQKQKMNEMK